MPGILLFIDFEKAFDNVDWEFLQKSLDCSSGYFHVKRGVRQGDPLSPYLFIFGIDILAVAIRSSKNIKGIKVGELETKSVFHADDTNGAVSDVKSAQILLLILKNTPD